LGIGDKEDKGDKEAEGRRGGGAEETREKN
jgi:hypothetical protein